MNSKNPNNEARIWITDQRFIPVDNGGYATSLCPEGAFGHLVRLFKIDAQGGSTPSNYGLKIPRLRGDSFRENSYIVQVLENEEREVEEINDPAATANTLLPAFENNPGLKRERPSFKKTRDSLGQQGHAIFVTFEKGLPPRFVCVKRLKPSQTPTEAGNDESTKPQFSVIPAGATADIEKWLTTAIWEKMETGSRRLQGSGADESWVVPVFHSEDELAEDAKAGLPLSYALDLRKTPRVWYAAVPSILFKWSSGTLQHAISSGKLKAWNLPKMFELFLNISSGLAYLHGLKKLHADIRPANVMAIGSAEKPESYLLGDYGSFSKGVSNFELIAADGPTLHTQIGPMVGRQRNAPFYSLERRTAEEKEDAGDTAVILQIQEAGKLDEYFVYIGWAAEFGDSKPSDPINASKLEAVQNHYDELKNGKFTDTSHNQEDLLQPGDRLRIGDIVFEVSQSGRTREGNLVFRCKKRFARIIQDRLSVFSDEESLKNGSGISISQLVEYRQWSAATDLYGLGSLLLYCLFCKGQVENGSAENDLATNVLRRRTSKMFLEMMEQLESQPYLHNCWPDLCKFYSEFKAFEKLHGEEPSFQPEDHRTADGESLKEMGLRVAKVVHLAPHLTAILAGVEDNILYFLLFLHFTLSCLHRRAHLSAELADKSEFPFCSNRLEKPVPDGVAAKAQSHLLWLQGLLPSTEAAKIYKYFKCEKAELESLPRITNQGQLMDALKERNQLQVKVDELNRKLQEMVRLEADLKSAQACLKEMEIKMAQLKDSLSDKSKQLENVQQQLGSTVSETNTNSQISQIVKDRLPIWKGQALDIRSDFMGSKRKELLTEILRSLSL